MGNGFGMLAFASLANSLELAAQTTGLHHPAKAKHVIFLFMNGGLSQVDSFDPKPMLEKYHGQPLPGGSIATERKTGSLMKSPFAFKKYGKSGLEVTTSSRWSVRRPTTSASSGRCTPTSRTTSRRC